MRTVDYYEVLAGTADLCGVDRSQIEQTDFARFRDFHSNRLREAWQAARWPELLRVEQRQYRNTWAVGTAYTAGDEVFHPNSQAYYVALRASTGEEPADADDVINDAYWAELGGAPSTAEWRASTDYAAGDRVLNPSDLLTYSCHTAHTSGATFDATKFGAVPEFIRDIDYTQSWETNTIGDVVNVWDRNPRTNQNAKPVEFEQEDDRVIVLEEVARPWLQYRLTVPRLFGDAYSSTATYYAGQQVYYNGSSGASIERGNFYDIVSTTTPGDTPISAAAKFRKVEIPVMFAPYLKQGAFADWVPAEGEQAERRVIEQARAQSLIEKEWVRVAGQMRQRRQMEVWTR